MSRLCLCLGYFDSVHIGHRALIKRCSEYAASRGMRSAVYTFSQDKIGLFQSMYDYEERIILLKNAGADMTISGIFDRKTMLTSGKDFLDDLIENFDIGAFFCGYDYTFGKNAECDAQFLSDYARHNEIYCEVMPCFKAGGVKVSTSRIKELLSDGEVGQANILLGEPYFMKGAVVHGRGVGGRFGYPTANIKKTGFLPKAGVYKTKAYVGEAEYNAVTNVGPKPTFGDETVSVETMLIDFSGDIYGKDVILKFEKYLRPIQKFSDGEALRSQIQKDIKEALCCE